MGIEQLIKELESVVEYHVNDGDKAYMELHSEYWRGRLSQAQDLRHELHKIKDKLEEYYG